MSKERLILTLYVVQLNRVPLSARTCMPGLTAVPRALGLLPSSPPTMHAMLSNNSTDTTGREDRWRSVRIAMLVVQGLALAEVGSAGSAVEADSVAVDSPGEVDSAAASEVASVVVTAHRASNL